jgi:hypothetical protein
LKLSIGEEPHVIRLTDEDRMVEILGGGRQVGMRGYRPCMASTSGGPKLGAASISKKKSRQCLVVKSHV